MSIFRKKTSSEEIPEIPPIPTFPTFSATAPKAPTGLPEVVGDANNQEAIKMALGSSEKISGDSGAANSPSESLQMPPVNYSQIQTPPQRVSMLPPLPANPQPPKLPEVPKYTPKPAAPAPLPIAPAPVPEPPVKEVPLTNPFVQAPMPVEEPVQEEKFVKKDATESIFVRIDKFNSAKRDVEEIERDLKQISHVMEKINEVKLKEDEEITEITKTLEEIKNRINRIELDVFNRI